MVIASGNCGASGSNLTWVLNDDYSLVISGTGAMNAYSSSNTPWRNYRYNITSVTVSSGATTIGDYAFSNCIVVTSVTLPNTLTSIGNYAFYNCTALTSITIPSSVTTIKTYAFYYCSALTSITIPSTVTSIGASAFRNCSSIGSITFLGGTVQCGSSTFALGTSSKQVTAIVYSPNNWASTVLDNYKNQYTTFIYSALAFNVSLSVSPANTGTVTGAGTYSYGTQVTISATPAAHYHFVNWSDGSTQASRTFTVTGPVTLTANFAIDQHTISTAVSPAGTGSVTGAGTYNYGTAATLTATPGEEYEFEKWQDGNTSNPRTVTVTGNATYTAYFKLKRPPINIKVGGNWINGTTYVNVNGTWTKATKIFIKNNGTWNQSK